VQYLYEAQHVSGDTPPIIRNLKLNWQPLLFVRVVGGRCQATPDNIDQLHVQKAEAASSVLGS